jgi:hypothetical protein
VSVACQPRYDIRADALAASVSNIQIVIVTRFRCHFRPHLEARFARPSAHPNYDDLILQVLRKAFDLENPSVILEGLGEYPQLASKLAKLSEWALSPKGKLDLFSYLFWRVIRGCSSEEPAVALAKEVWGVSCFLSASARSFFFFSLLISVNLLSSTKVFVSFLCCTLQSLPTR